MPPPLAIAAKPIVGLTAVGDGADPDRVTLALVGGQPPVAPRSGFGGGGDERLVPQVAEGDVVARGEPVAGGQRYVPRLCDQHLDPEARPGRGKAAAAGRHRRRRWPARRWGPSQEAARISTRQPGRRRVKAAMICVGGPRLAAPARNSDPEALGAAWLAALLASLNA
jgi:hypothetical protein